MIRLKTENIDLIYRIISEERQRIKEKLIEMGESVDPFEIKERKKPRIRFHDEPKNPEEDKAEEVRKLQLEHKELLTLQLDLEKMKEEK